MGRRRPARAFTAITVWLFLAGMSSSFAGLCAPQDPPKKPSFSPGIWVGTFRDSRASGFLEIVVTPDGAVNGRYVTSKGETGTLSGRTDAPAGPLPFRLDDISTPEGCDQNLEPSVWMTEGFVHGSYKVENCGRKHKGEARIFRLPEKAAALIGDRSEPGAIQFVNDPARFRNARRIALLSEDAKVRTNVSKRLDREPRIALTDSIEMADVLLVVSEVRDEVVGEISGGPLAGQWYDTWRYAIGIAAHIADGNRLIIFWTFQDDNTTHFERRPSTNFARNFLKAYAKQNKPRKP